MSWTGDRRIVAPLTILGQGLHHDPVEVAPNEPAQPRRLGLADFGEARQRSDELSRLLGVGGSTSRIIRSISSSAAFLNVSRSIGVLPVRSS